MPSCSIVVPIVPSFWAQVVPSADKAEPPEKEGLSDQDVVSDRHLLAHRPEIRLPRHGIETTHASTAHDVSELGKAG